MGIWIDPIEVNLFIPHILKRIILEGYLIYRVVFYALMVIWIPTAELNYVQDAKKKTLSLKMDSFLDVATLEKFSASNVRIALKSFPIQPFHQLSITRNVG